MEQVKTEDWLDYQLNMGPANQARLKAEYLLDMPLEPSVFREGPYSVSLDAYGEKDGKTFKVEIDCPAEGKESRMWARMQTDNASWDRLLPEHYLRKLAHQHMVCPTDETYFLVWAEDDFVFTQCFLTEEFTKRYTPLGQPDVGRFSEEDKTALDTFIAESDAIGILSLRRSKSEVEWANLYHSFQKGTKGKFQQIMDALYRKGEEMVQEWVTIIDVSVESGDEISELIEEMGALREFVEARVSMDAAQAMREEA